MRWMQTVGLRLLKDRSLLFFCVLAMLAIALCWRLRGGAEVAVHAGEAVDLIARVAPELVLGVVIASFLTVLLPQEKVARLLGAEAGIRGILFGTAIGAVLPGGPFASFPLVLALFKAGADMGALIAFLVAWGTIGINRLIVWEIPFMGAEFGMLRLVSSIPIPIIAGLIARWLVRRHRFFHMPRD